jgi:hypothetical protein
VKHHLSKLSNLHKSEALRRTRFSKASLVIFALIFAAIGGYLIYRSFAAASDTANLWVDTNGGSCTRSATPVTYNDATACSSFDTAYSAASYGDLVYVKAGNYPDQTVTNKSNKTATTDQADVTIKAATSETVTISDLQIGVWDANNGPNNLTLSGFADNDQTTSGDCSWEIAQGTKYLTYENLDSCNWYARGTDHVTIKGGDWGPCKIGVGPSCGNNKFDSLGSESNTNSTVDGAFIHDFRARPGDQFECMFLRGTDGITIQNTKFENCAFMDLFIQEGGQPNKNIVIQNNWFDQPWSDDQTPATQNRSTAIDGAIRPADSMLMRYNTFDPGTTWNWGPPVGGGTYSNMRFVGNIAKWDSGSTCNITSISYQYNVLNGGKCGATDINASASFVNGSHLGNGGDWHLASGSNPAKDIVTATTSDFQLNYDMDGDTRPQGAARDAGADESVQSLGNIFVVNSGGSSSCVRQAIPVSFTSAPASAKCDSFDSAYNAANFGDSVIATCASGNSCSISHQIILEKVAKETTSDMPDIVFSPENGKTVTVAGIESGNGDGSGGTNGADHITLKNFVMPNASVDCQIRMLPDSYDFTIDNVKACNFEIIMGHDITIKNSTFGPCNASQSICQNSRVDDGVGSTTNISIMNNYFHDYIRDLDNQHFECLVVWGVTGTKGLYVGGNKLWRCATVTMAYYLENSASKIQPALIENNFFDHPLDIGLNYTVNLGQPAINMKNCAPVNDLTVRFNSFAPGAITSWDGCGLGQFNNVKEIGDVGRPDCRPDIAQTYNVFTTELCAGTGNTLISSLSDVFVNGNMGTTDFNLKSGANVAVNKVPAALCPATDINGTTRAVSDGFCDAGAYERTGAVTPPPTPPPPTPTPPPPASDTSPPSVPQGLSVTGKTQTTISISWSASTDNVAVTGYKLYNGNTLLSTTSNLNYIFTGLTCNTTYSNLSLTAIDASGNESDKNQSIVVATTTNACGPKTGDINGDNSIDITDLSLLLSSYGQNTTQCITNNAFKCDLSSPGDGIVNIFDLSTLLSNYGK